MHYPPPHHQRKQFRKYHRVDADLPTRDYRYSKKRGYFKLAYSPNLPSKQ